MDISKMKKVMVTGPSDGHEHALIKGNTVYLVMAHGIEEAKMRLEKMKIAPTDRWLPSEEKAVLIPGLWEYKMATFQGAV
jgi:hypothetical protein|tara:strand:+ start:328 stop:567 length:240 start_codon:yes stop_codon:yes gene_type:complete